MERIETLRIQERDALLARLRDALTGDPRVVAAWLYGSLGRGEGDAWSDLDVWVVVADAAYDPAMRHDLPVRLGPPLFTQEAPQNGPSGGTYLMSAHDAPTGPHLVDWYLQPQAHARRTDSAVVLVDRAVLSDAPPDDAPHAPWTLTPDEDAANKAMLFWAMRLVQAKWIARRPDEAENGFEGFILSLLRDVAAWRGVALDEALPTGRLERLSALGAKLAAVAPELAGPRASSDRFLAAIGGTMREP